MDTYQWLKLLLFVASSKFWRELKKMKHRFFHFFTTISSSYKTKKLDKSVLEYLFLKDTEI